MERNRFNFKQNLINYKKEYINDKYAIKNYNLISF